jgi:hypothetical protein
VIPYGAADSAIGVAVIDLPPLLDALCSAGVAAHAGR